ncbi:MAG TPA: hypothetical protein PKJ63_01985 [Cyclobacteriaceae bacterium]|nr:hypothetical protein [Cyclobacteriaceae bacterium]
MKTKKTKTPSSSVKRNRERRYNIIITSVVIAMFTGWAVWQGYHIYQQEKYDYMMREGLKSMPLPGFSVDPKVVCMVNNMYVGVDQIPVPIEGRTYYGCCDQCVRDLTNNENVRHAIDPYSKVSVDKAHAFITIDPAKKGAILYFESEENAKKYVGGD